LIFLALPRGRIYNNHQRLQLWKGRKFAFKFAEREDFVRNHYWKDKKMKKSVCIFLLLFIVGCGDNYSEYSNYSPYTPDTGFSLYIKKVKGSSNLTNGYNDPPSIDANSPLVQFQLENDVKDYLNGVVNDLKEVKDKSDNAEEKINAVLNAVNIGLENFSFGFNSVGSVSTFSIFNTESNFGLLEYPEFPDFHYSLFFPTKPSKPLYLNDDFAVESYNASVREYNREIADLAETVKDYIEDAEHYIDNCKNDYELIRKKGLYVESLGINPKVSRYYAELEKQNVAYKKVTEPNTTSKNEVASRSHSTNSAIPQQAIPQESQIDDSGRKIIGYQVDTSKKDASGHFIKTPVYENEQKK
jgi:hypothetical protein